MHGTVSADPAQIQALSDLVNHAERILIVAGPRTPGGDFPQTLNAFAQATGAVILADPLSNLRFHSDVTVCGAYDSFIPAGVVPLNPDLVIQVGAPPASKMLEDFFSNTDLPAHILLTEDGTWTDPYHRLTHVFHADPSGMLRAVTSTLKTRASQSEWRGIWQAAEHAAWIALTAALAQTETFFDGAAVHALLEALPDDINLFVASSLSVRHVEQYGRPRTSELRIFCNRGASGIDGTIASALGVAAASERPTILLIGDVAMYHDLNSLLAAQRTKTRLITILLNNQGGGIFRRLPIVDFEPQFSDLFLTPTGLDFHKAADLFNVTYKRAETPATLVSQMRNALRAETSTLIEVQTHADEDLRLRKILVQRITAQLKSVSLP
jgi:2-succinyl-5-enolpyruvyl-6-hydroxy-3-cyclohexene-1-carboxylate synthase